MDVTLKFDTVEDATAAVKAAHPAAYKLEAMSQDGYRDAAYFDSQERVVIVIADCSDDANDPENVRLHQVNGDDWARSLDVVDEYEYELGKLEEGDDDVDNSRARQLISETLTVVAACDSAKYPSQGSDELQRGDDEARSVNLSLALQIERLKTQMSLLSSLRAQNILNRLGAREHRHGAKREVADALGMKPQNIQDVLAAYYRRLNMLD